MYMFVYFRFFLVLSTLFRVVGLHASFLHHYSPHSCLFVCARSQLQVTPDGLINYNELVNIMT